MPDAGTASPAGNGSRTLDQYMDLLGLPSGGALRASVGLASNVEDVERFLAAELRGRQFLEGGADGGAFWPGHAGHQG